MNEPGVQVLLDQETIESRIEDGSVPDWVKKHFRTFKRSMLGERNDAPFPCYFGIEVMKQGDLLYTAVGSPTDKEDLLRFRDTLLEYLDTYPGHADRAPLVAFFRPPDRELSEAAYHERLWNVLQFLHVHDPEPWPEDIPTDPDTPRWEFCFGGEAMFPTSRAPFYDDRMSRYCPIGLEITFQPRAVFEGITADTVAGQRARKVIQDRLEDYDGVCPHANIGDWGVEGDREWHQYLLPSDDEQAPETCPMEPSREHPKVSERLLTPGRQRSPPVEAE
ncbi:YqcI/YcgG family protein [Halalkalirubrum salinum]|uniref:YqcI/YcgG family protein n=1 Tax=Halalkalirubrum salinum TaxID=2563889 RepID=UPI0010FB842A|nr:YqcI/YcgG family protein [Halalkalirubrum salinum]